MSRFPFPMPFGWFKVAMPDDIPAGTIVSRRAFGTEVVLWRDKTDHVVCQEAFCPHLGAHIGVGGHVEESCVRCPFHGWLFDDIGRNVEIPYATRPNRKSRLKTYPTRLHAGIIFAWYHPDGQEPLWDLMGIPEYDDPAFGQYEIFNFSVRTCLQEMAENGYDHAHFQFVHSHPKVGTVEKIEFSGYDRTVLSSQQFPSSRGPVDARIDIFGRGPGVAVTRYRGLIDASLIGCSTPVDEDTSDLSFHFTLKNPTEDARADNIARAFVRSVTSEVGQDIPIWENKRFRPTPALASSEKPITQFRRWFQQFYTGAVQGQELTDEAANARSAVR